MQHERGLTFCFMRTLLRHVRLHTSPLEAQIDSTNGLPRANDSHCTIKECLDETRTNLTVTSAPRINDTIKSKCEFGLDFKIIIPPARPCKKTNTITPKSCCELRAH